MIRGYTIESGHLRPVADPLAHPDVVAWFDLEAPTPDEEAGVERLVGIDVPTFDEMAEIEDSARLYVDGGAAFMTAMLPTRADTGHPVGAPVTFILAAHRLVTVRYDTPRAFETFPARAERLDLGCSSGETVLLALLDAIVERLADILEATGARIEALSREIFGHGTGKGAPDFRGLLANVGSNAGVVSHVLSSLVTIERLIAFLAAARDGDLADKEARTRLKSLSRDARFLSEHASFLSQKINFLLDATLGMISIQQNAIIKIFSVAAVIFLPPTLVASIYGMNFSVMPELHWAYGYPVAILLMIASAAGSYLFFKTRGWL
jgi:magnesium transporter